MIIQSNKSLMLGDCKNEMKLIQNNSIDLVYLDPPFFKQRKQKLSNGANQEFSFEDTWDSIGFYKDYIKERLEGCRKVLKDTGSIFLHCDRSASHHLRIILDELFGVKNFQSEIVWFYKRWSNSKKGLLNSHQIIFFYSKSSNFKFNTFYTDYSPTTNIDQIFQERQRNSNGKTVYKTARNGDVKLLNSKKGVPLSDVWEIPYLNPKAKERVGYPTQKPILLLENIIKLVTDEGDTVLDPFCGSGTTLVASKLLNRKYIGIEQSNEAVKIAESRLCNPIRTESKLLKLGKSAYLNQDKETMEILDQIDAVPVQRNKGIDGFLKIQNDVKPIPVRIQKKNEDINEAINLLINACVKNKFIDKIFIRNSESMNDITINDKGLLILNSVNELNSIKHSLFYE